MSLLSQLSQLDLMAIVTASVINIYLVVPAYRRTKHKGFLFWGFGAFGSLWNTVTLHTIGANPYTNPDGYYFVHYSYRILFFIDATLSITGTVMVVRSYLHLFEATQKTSLLAAKSNEFEST